MSQRSRPTAYLPLSLCLCFAGLALTIKGSPAQAQAESEWKREWAVRGGYSISIDTQGFELPSALAFVPNPGPDPKDPLYYLTELTGAIKVVTNDRSVSTFAEDFFTRDPEEELPDIAGEVGMAGICLDPVNGYVFATFSYSDSEGILRNNIVRFGSSPERFSLAPDSMVTFTEVFADHETVPSHQIGNCRVQDGALYVGVGDGRQSPQATQTDSLFGKVLRMTLDGKPMPDNPFYEDEDIKKPANFVWAYGLRNPFGLEIVDGRVFVADNGRSVDRFLEARAGENYLWDGTDSSLAASADALLLLGAGVAQLEHYPTGSDLFGGEFEDTFFLTITGNMKLPKDRRKPPEILAVQYSLDRSRLVSVPEPIIRYRGESLQVIAALAFGPDGLYFAPLYPDPDGLTAVFKVTYEPANQHPYLITDFEGNPVELMSERGCFGCHALGNRRAGTLGPALDREALLPRLEMELNTAAYEQALKEVDLLEREPYVSFVDARAEVLEAQGLDRVRVWMRYRILEPRFDGPNNQMPNLGLTEDEALLLTDYLLREDASEAGSFTEAVISRLREVLPSPAGRRHLVYFFAGGFAAGSVSLAALLGLYRFVRSRRSA